MTPVRREVERRLDAGSMCGVPKTEGVCRDLLKPTFKGVWSTGANVYLITG